LEKNSQTGTDQSNGFHRRAARRPAAHPGRGLFREDLFPAARRLEPETRRSDAEFSPGSHARAGARKTLANLAAKRLAHVVSAPLTGELDHGCRSWRRSIAGARHREPFMAASPWARPCQHAKRFWFPRRASDAPGFARLAGERVDPKRLAIEIASQTNHDQRRLHASLPNGRGPRQG